MAELRLKYRFSSLAAPDDAFHVLDFHGVEGLSQLFRFDLTLATARNDLEPEDLLQEPAEFSIVSEVGILPFFGVLSSFSVHRKTRGLTVCKARLVPALQRLTITRHNQIFLDQNLKQFLQQALTDAGLEEGQDFEFKLENDYPKREYVCQYNESHFAFISRWMEREGLYYYFDQTPQGRGKLVITDSNTVHAPLKGGEILRHAPPSGMQDAHGDEVLTRFSLTQHPMPAAVMVQDWNYRTPSLAVQGSESVDKKGRGQFNFYGHHVATPSQAKALAKIRAQELLCRQQVFSGESSAPYLRSGFTVTLQDHYRSDFNQEYLLTSVEHKGTQASYILEVMDKGSGDESRITYSNTFEAMASSVQFRPQRTTAWPRSSGVMHAFVDAAGSGQYAELDDQGRYKVRLPFDRSGRPAGQASSWLRMAQPYGGADHGFHCPLHKNTEVLLACVNGDVDRPMILSSVPNPDTPSQITAGNQTGNRLTTSSGNTLYMEDKDGQQHIMLHNPKKDTFWCMGAQSGPPPTVATPPGAKDSSGQPAAQGSSDSGSQGSAASAGSGSSSNPAGTQSQGTTASQTQGSTNGSGSGVSSSNGGDNKDDEKEEKSGFAGQSLYTSKALTIKAGSSFTVVFGNSSETYLGLDVSTVLGVFTTMILGFEVGMTMAFQRDFKPMHNRLFETHATLAAAETKEAATAQTLVDEMNTLHGRITTLSQQVTKLAQDNTTLAQEKTTLAQEKTTLAQEKIDLAQETTSLAQTVTRLGQNNTKLAQQVSSLCQENTQLCEEITDLSQETSELAQTVTEMSEDQLELVEEIQELGTAVNNLAEFISYF